MLRWIGVISIFVFTFLPGVVLQTAAGLDLVSGHAAGDIHRRPVVELHPNIHADSPTIAVLSDGRVGIAYVVEQHDREQIWFRWADGPDLVLGEARVVSTGIRASCPRLAVQSTGAVWLTWCGLDISAKDGKFRRQVYLRKIAPGEMGPVLLVSTSTGWSCAPRIAVGPQDTIHIVWEQGKSDRIGIAYRMLSAQGKALGSVKLIDEGAFARRPDVCVANNNVHVAWDKLVSDAPTGKPDPDYDVYFRSRIKGVWQPIIKVDTREGIQAAPSLTPHPQKGILVAYHSTHRHPLVKWWTIRRVKGQNVEAISAVDAASEAEPQGQLQGAEFPVLLVAQGRILVLSRPSQGAYIQTVDASKINQPVDLHRLGWGVRGIQAEMAEALDGSILAVRRGKNRILLERFTLTGSSTGWPGFVTVSDPPKKSSDRSRHYPMSATSLTGDGAARGFSLMFGDPHMHSAMSDGTGPADEVLARAWSRGLDFAALTDHDVVVGFGMMPSKFDEIAWLSDVFNAKVGFVTLQAFEWTTAGLPKGSGHRNVYFQEQAPTKICRSIDACENTEKLLAWLKRNHAISIPHHTSWTGTEWRTADVESQRLFEVVSIHGVSEYEQNQPIKPRGNMPGMFARDALKRGLRFGFVGGSDSHGLLWHHGMGWKEDPWTGGATGVYVSGGKREELFDALYQRRCFATSGARMAVWLSAGGIDMGGEGIVDPPVELDYQLIGLKKPTIIEMVRDGMVVGRIESPRSNISGKWKDDKMIEPGWHSYYIRVMQGRDNYPDMAWSSPVFIRVPKGDR